MSSAAGYLKATLIPQRRNGSPMHPLNHPLMITQQLVMKHIKRESWAGSMSVPNGSILQSPVHQRTRATDAAVTGTLAFLTAGIVVDIRCVVGCQLDEALAGGGPVVVDSTTDRGFRSGCRDLSGCV